MVKDGVGIAEVSRISGISEGFPFSLEEETLEGDGDRTIEGPRPCWEVNFGFRREGSGDCESERDGADVVSGRGAEGSQ